ncbi:hypothetical protein HID58_094374 [Brassica napus]|uniref:CCHC-type domain-containing protein n=1 Tax=Brassica napus TaxID=3708 RepID=A0ABQ7X7J4_BRANA|nr:hypothetical protein HID58_094374 [Brassica napus]
MDTRRHSLTLIGRVTNPSAQKYPNGDEVTATLVYENLEKHCLHCGRLDHEIRDCLEAKHQNKERLPAQKDSQKNRADHSSGRYSIQRFQHQKNYQRDSLPNNRHGRDWSHGNVENTSHRRNPPTHKERGTFSGDSHSTAAPRDMAFSEH